MDITVDMAGHTTCRLPQKPIFLPFRLELSTGIVLMRTELLGHHGNVLQMFEVKSKLDFIKGAHK